MNNEEISRAPWHPSENVTAHDLEPSLISAPTGINVVEAAEEILCQNPPKTTFQKAVGAVVYGLTQLGGSELESDKLSHRPFLRTDYGRRKHLAKDAEQAYRTLNDLTYACEEFAESCGTSTHVCDLYAANGDWYHIRSEPEHAGTFRKVIRIEIMKNSNDSSSVIAPNSPIDRYVIQMNNFKFQMLNQTTGKTVSANEALNLAVNIYDAINLRKAEQSILEEDTIERAAQEALED